MFTIEQIKTAHSKVKSGADFPSYIQEMKSLGIKSYQHFVSDGHIPYYGVDDFTLAANAKWSPIEIAEKSSIEMLKHYLSIHQQGQTDYVSFCKQAAESGVEKWIVDIGKMTCAYYDKMEKEMLAEIIPEP